MNTIIPVANTVLGNEPALSLYEIHEQSPDASGFHRYQLIYVVRGDKPAEFRRDLGLAKNFKNTRQVRIPSFMEHTVDELMDIADQIRNEDIQDEIDVRELLGVYK